RIEELRRLWPIIGLLGASLPNQIVPGLLDVWRAVLVCEENREAVRETLGYVPEELLLPAERWVCDYQYTRGDAAKMGVARPEKRDKSKEQAQLMIFSGQAIQRGALWAHGFVLRHPTSLYLGCLLWSLRLWQSAGGTIGSQAARGHGQLRLYVLDGDLAQEELCQQYVEHCRSVKEEAVAWLSRNVK
ncbi:MAG TPA: hypothetical protein G4O05_03135, partial [Caldilineae bacterium]|nr:hypothetical protein [Caldilineae bacterium]